MRLQKAKQWILTSDGKHLLRRYKKHFKVDPGCAINDLYAIGAISEEKFIVMKRSEEARRLKKRKDKELRKMRESSKHDNYFDDESNDVFYYIAGYTSGGFPFGVTWEEMRERYGDGIFDDDFVFEDENDENDENDEDYNKEFHEECYEELYDEHNEEYYEEYVEKFYGEYDEDVEIEDDEIFW